VRAIYDDHLEIVNPGNLHFGITPKKLTRPHESKPWNPIIANVFYRAGIIERWGSGTLNIIDWCAENANPKPTWQEQAGSVYVTFLPAVLPAAQRSSGQIRPKPDPSRDRVPSDAGTKSELSRDQVTLLKQSREERGIAELMTAFGRTNRTKFRNQLLTPLIEAGLIEMTVPDKPRSSKQRYRLTEKGELFSRTDAATDTAPKGNSQ